MKTGWSTITLSEIAVHRGGSVNPAKFKDDMFELYSIPAYDQSKPEILFGKDIGSAKKYVQPNDVLLSRIVPHIQRVWVVGNKGNTRQIASSEWIIYRSNRFHSKFLRYALLTKKFHAQFMRTISGVGGSLLRARPDLVGQIEIPLPPLKEQKRIAAILDKTEAIRRKRRQAIQLADELLRSVFLDMFGDPVTNEKGWKRCNLEDVLENIDSGWSPKCLNRVANQDEWGVLKLGAVTSCLYLDHENKALPCDLEPRENIEVKKGDLLFTRKNTYELVAACAFVYGTRPKLMLSDTIFRFNFKRNAAMLPEYVWALFTHPGKRRDLQKLAGGSAGSMPNISKSRLMKQLIELPPIKLQDKFKDVLHRVRSCVVNQSSAHYFATEFFNSLSQKAFRGEL